jgi:hypothetical protein
MGSTTTEGTGKMNIEQLDDATRWTGSTWVDVLAKAILLNKVSIKDGRIMVKPFTENEL